jgi:hypothetical protein
MNPSKQKGTAFERGVVEFLQANGFPLAERRVTRGSKDAGDVAGIPAWVLELKATRLINLAGAIDEARVEAKNAGVQKFAAIVKRRGKNISEAYFVLPLSAAVELLR